MSGESFFFGVAVGAAVVFFGMKDDGFMTGWDWLDGKQGTVRGYYECVAEFPKTHDLDTSGYDVCRREHETELPDPKSTTGSIYNNTGFAYIAVNSDVMHGYEYTSGAVIFQDWKESKQIAAYTIQLTRRPGTDKLTGSADVSIPELPWCSLVHDSSKDTCRSWTYVSGSFNRLLKKAGLARGVGR